VPEARLVVVGFGGFRDGLLELLAALAEGDRDAVRAIAQAGRDLEGGPRAPLRHLLAFLETADDDYWAAARDLRERVFLTGRLEHDELAPLLAACEALVFPSTFPEAYGMVAAEAAACGVLPISAGHSGAKEVSAMLAQAVPAEAREWLSFPIDDDAVRAIAARVRAWLEAPDDVRAATRAALIATARERFSWEGVAGGVLAAAQGRLAELPPVA
jgi:glycosyltransferase involved in cell wall biosynthesis